MNTLMFSLGIAFVVVIIIAIVAVFAFVKVIKLDNILSDFHRKSENDIREVYNNISNNMSDSWRSREEMERGIHNRISDMYTEIERKFEAHGREFTAVIDSRIDKLQNKQKQIK